jgi:hypothetical protein
MNNLFSKEMNMKNLSLITAILALTLSACSKKPAEAPAVQTTVVSKIEFASPADGAKLDAKANSQLDYNIALGEDGGDHAHIYVDERRVAMLRQMQGNFVLFPLDPGAHEICIKVVNSTHMPNGVSRCIKVTAE